MTAEVVRPPAVAVGLSQQEIVEFASRLSEQGTPREVIAKVTDTLQGIAVEAATAATFRGATAIAVTLESTRQRLADNQVEQVDLALRTLRTAIQSMPATLGHINKATVVATLNSMLTTPEPSRSAQVINQRGA